MKYSGEFKGIFRVCPPGSLRLIKIDDKKFRVNFKEGYRQTEDLDKGDLVTIDYKDSHNFKIEKNEAWKIIQDAITELFDKNKDRVIYNFDEEKGLEKYSKEVE